MKIQNVGIGNYIRNPRGRKLANSDGSAVEVLRVDANQGNSFLCFPVVGYKAGASENEAVLDRTRYLQIPIDTEVQQVTI